jgi:hypothetical protein
MPGLVDPPCQMPIRKCDLCADLMKHLSNVPRTAKGAEIRVFRCYECCLVTTEIFDSATSAWTRYEILGDKESPPPH